MTMELVDGRAGQPHIDSQDMAILHQALFGDGDYVLDCGEQLACTMQDANHALIGTGAAMIQGLAWTVTATETVKIDSGTQAMRRNDVVCAHYHRDTTSMVESISFDVFKGNPTDASVASDPEIPDTDILSGATDSYMPLWRIPIDGITVGAPVSLFKLAPRVYDIQSSVMAAVDRLFPVGSAVLLRDGLQPSDLGYPGGWTMQNLALQAVGTDKYLNHDGDRNGAKVQLWTIPTAAAQWYPRGIAQGGGRIETPLTMWVRTS